MSNISQIRARQILDSRGNPTVEVDVITEKGFLGRAAVPSGASTGKHEAMELRDNDKKYYLGKGVLHAVGNVNGIINNELKGTSVYEQVAIDNMMIELDGTENKSRLGANAILGVSLATAKAASLEVGQPLFKYVGGVDANLLPIPMMNILNGGAHADNSVDFQEFMIMPIGAKKFSESLRMRTEVFHHLKTVLKKRGMATNVGDEGGFAPNLKSNEDAMEVVLEAISNAGYRAGTDIFIALDPASSEFYDTNKAKYVFKKSSGQELTSEEMAKYWADWASKFPIVSIEDGMAEDDWQGWKMLTELIGSKVQLVGEIGRAHV